MTHKSILATLRGFWPAGRRRNEAGEDVRAARNERAMLLPFARGRRGERAIALALQGGGAHGAFTWGVLDRILEEERTAIEALSGTSAGAINAAVLASAYVRGGATAAREQLQAFWQTLVELGRISPLQPTPLETIAFGRDMEMSFSYMLRDMISRVVSPYQFNPFDLNPLRELLLKHVDFDALRRPDAIRLFVAATNAETGACRIFTNEELSAEVLLGSACVPSVHHAPRIDDAYYWDGGFSANPPLLPLIEGCAARDVVIVRLNPSRENGLPTAAPKIQTRLSRIVFDAPLRQELETLERLRRMAADGGVRTSFARRLSDLRLHTIGEDDLMNEVGGASKAHPDRRLVLFLKDQGYAAGARWIAQADSEGAVVTTGITKAPAISRMARAFL